MTNSMLVAVVGRMDGDDSDDDDVVDGW